MNLAFRENFNDEKHADPLDGHGSIGFPWDELFERLGEPSDTNTTANGRNYAVLGDAVNKFICYAIGDGKLGDGCERQIARRVFVIANYIDPSMASRIKFEPEKTKHETRKRKKPDRLASNRAAGCPAK